MSEDMESAKRNETDGAQVLELSEAEERLLTRYLDGECGFWSKRKAERLLSERAEAQAFADFHSAIRKSLSSVELSPKLDGALWSRIEARIAAEERAEVFLGRRFENRFPAQVMEFLRESFGLRVAGAVAAAALIVFVFLPGRQLSIGGTYSKNQIESSGSASPQVVELARSGAVPGTTPLMSLVSDGRRMDRPRIIEERAPSTVEVDWMRSQGRVQVIQGGGNAPILWVKKRPRRVIINQEPASVGLNDEN